MLLNSTHSRQLVVTRVIHMRSPARVHHDRREGLLDDGRPA